MYVLHAMYACCIVNCIGATWSITNVVDDMTRVHNEEQRTLPNDEVVLHKDFKIHRIPVTGDQVTVAARHNSENKLDHLEGALPFVEDWHARQTLMMVY